MELQSPLLNEHTYRLCKLHAYDTHTHTYTFDTSGTYTIVILVLDYHSGT